MPNTPRRLLFISNGHGEDSIAAAIVGRLPPGLIVEAYPTIGSGAAYANVCPIVGPRARLASEGWRNVKGSVLRDIASGGLMTTLPGLKFLRQARTIYDRVVVVGDLVGVAGCWLAGIRDIVYLDVYRTGFGRPYGRAERWLISRVARVAFNRHPDLAASLQRSGVDARFAGNVMMDAIPRGDYDAYRRRRARQAVTLLPGSRQWVPESFRLQIEALRLLPTDVMPDVFVAIAGGVSIDTLARAANLDFHGPMTGEAGDLGMLAKGALTVHLARGSVIGNLFDASDLVLSQAGTATTQAVGLGVPALTFINPRDRASRVRDENRLFGDARRIVEADPAKIAGAVAALLADDAERGRCSAIGRARIGGPGAMVGIVDAVAAR